MASWQVQEAKARLSKVIEEAWDHGPQVITKHGAERAVILSIHDYHALMIDKKPTFTEFLLSVPKVDDFEIVRDQDTGREVDL